MHKDTIDLAGRVEALRGVALFEDIQDNLPALQGVASMMVEKKFKPGAFIIKESENGTEAFILVHGHAEVFKSTTEGDLFKVAILTSERRSFFGEGALLDADARSATIQATTECHCLALSYDLFESFSTSHPDWALPILRRIARTVLARLQKSNHDMMLLYNALVAEIRGHH